MSGKIQVAFVDGGMTFRNRDDYLEFLREREVSLKDEKGWCKGDYLEKELEAEFVKLEMPCLENANYEDWRITFEKYIPLLKNTLILVGFSLGGIFLAKYLSENSLPKKVISVNLVAPPFDDSLPEDDLTSGFKLGSDLSMIEENTRKIRLFFSQDDDVVPAGHAEKYRKNLENIEINIYEERNGHFQTEEFPELVEKLNQEITDEKSSQEKGEK